MGVRTLKNEISVFVRSPGELSHPFHHVHTERWGPLWIRKCLSPDAQSAGNLMSDFPASRTVRNTCLLFISHASRSILLQQCQRTKTLSLSLSFMTLTFLKHTSQILWRMLSCDSVKVTHYGEGDGRGDLLFSVHQIRGVWCWSVTGDIDLSHLVKVASSRILQRGLASFLFVITRCLGANTLRWCKYTACA